MTAILAPRFLLSLQSVRLRTEGGGESSFSQASSLSFMRESTGRLGSIGSVLQPQDFWPDDQEEMEDRPSVSADEQDGI